MNNDQATVSAAKVNRFGDWIQSMTQKVTGLFKKPKKETPKFTYATVTDAIKFIEWRTQYDQMRIIDAVETISAIKAYPELCAALGVKYPGSHKVNANIVITDSSFERRLIKFFGFEGLDPQTKLLLLGGETKAQKQPRTIEFAEMFQRNIRQECSSTANSYVTRLLQEFELVLNAIQVAIDESEIEQPTLVALPAAEEVIEVVAEMLPIEEIEQPITVEQPVKTIEKKADKKPASKNTIFVKTEKKTKKLAHCTIPEMKAFAKRKGFPVPGAITVKNDIQAYITEKFNATKESN